MPAKQKQFEEYFKPILKLFKSGELTEEQVIKTIVEKFWLVKNGRYQAIHGNYFHILVQFAKNGGTFNFQKGILIYIPCGVKTLEVENGAGTEGNAD